MSLRGVAPQDPSHRLRQHCSEMWCSKTRLLRKRVCGIRFKSPGQAVMEEVESRQEKQIRPEEPSFDARGNQSRFEARLTRSGASRPSMPSLLNYRHFNGGLKHHTKKYD
jgi:hypothetical protein